MNKPLGRKSYGSIPHLPNSRMGPADHHCHEGQAVIATLKKKHKHQRIYVQEKLDGSNVGVALKDDLILPITRAGYLANTSPHLQHKIFHDWVLGNEHLFRGILKEGERLCGEWMLKAHGTIYDLRDTIPFIPFDIIDSDNNRIIWDNFQQRVSHVFTTPFTLSEGCHSVDEALLELGEMGRHGALEPIEGAVWRIEDHQKQRVDALVKYVKKEKIDGKYFLQIKGEQVDVWNLVNWGLFAD